MLDHRIERLGLVKGRALPADERVRRGADFAMQGFEKSRLADSRLTPDKDRAAAVRGHLRPSCRQGCQLAVAADERALDRMPRSEAAGVRRLPQRTPGGDR